LTDADRAHTKRTRTQQTGQEEAKDKKIVFVSFPTSFDLPVEKFTLKKTIKKNVSFLL
jgi:hypothetical protein